MNRYLLGALGLFIALGGGWLYGQHQYGQGKADCQTEQYAAELESFRNEAERLTGLSTALEGYAAELRDAKPKIIERITRVQAQNPMPPGCIIPLDGLREINAAIAQANATGKSRGSVPGD